MRSVNAMNRTLVHALTCLALAGATLICFGRVVDNDFVNIDDPMYVAANPHVQAGLTWPSVKWAWTSLDAGFWIPLTWLSLELDATLYWPAGGNGPLAASAAALGFHLTNLLLHVVNTLLVYWLFWRLTGSAGVAVCVAGLFGIHPLHVESVAWITERKDMLSACFGLLALLCFVRYQEKPSAGRMAVVTLFFAMSLMSKPVLVTLPALMLLLDWWRRRSLSPASLTRVIVEKVPLFALSLSVTALTVAAHRQISGVAELALLPLSTRWANALVSYQSYLVKTFAPIDLAVFYPHPGLSRQPVAILQTGQAALLLAGITAVALVWRNTIPALLVGWLWFLGALVPNIGLIQAGNQSMADRFSYFALLGLFLGIVAVGDRLARQVRLPGVVIAVVVAVPAAALAILSWLQVGYWKDSRTLYLHALEVTQNNAYVHGLLGIHLSEIGDLDGAERHLATATAAVGFVSFAEFHYAYGHVLLERGRKTGAADPAMLLKAWRHLERAISLKPSHVLAHYELAVAQIGLGELAAARKTIADGLEASNDPHIQANLRRLLKHCEEPTKAPAAPGDRSP